MSEAFRNTLEWEKIYQKCKSSPILFARVMFPELTNLQSPDFHYELEDLYLDPDNDKVSVIAPRDHGKSALVAEIFPLHHIVFGRGEKFVLLVSKTQGLAKRRLRTIKNMIYEPKFRRVFGHMVGTEENSVKWNSAQVVVEKQYRQGGKLHKNKWTIVTKGLRQPIRGMREKFTRPTYIAVDDPENEENTKTIDSMNDNYGVLQNSLVPAVDSERGRIWVIGTPLHQRCMVMRLKHRIDWKDRHYSAEYDSDREISLWPEKYSWEELMAKKEAAAKDNPPKLSSYYQEYCCKIVPDEKRLFKEDYLQYYQGEIEHTPHNTYLNYQLVDRYGNKIGEPERTPVRLYTGIDVATSTSNQADYFVIFTIAVDPENNRFVLPYFRDRVRPTTAIQQVINEYRKYKPIRVSIETSAQQEIMRDVLRNQKDEYIPGLHKKHNPREKKEKRHLEMLEPWLSANKVFIQRNMSELVDEMMMHPKGQTDDLLDGMYYAFLHARPPRRVQSDDDGRDLGKGQYPGVKSKQSWMLA